jgi:hypothetical protein
MFLSLVFIYHSLGMNPKKGLDLRVLGENKTKKRKI